MKKYRSRKALIEDIEALKNSDVYARALLLNYNISIIVFKESIKSDCDYIDVYYDANTKILSGRPVNLLSKFKKEQQKEDEGVFASIEDLTPYISKRRVPLDHLHHWFEGLVKESYVSEKFESLQVPNFIKRLEPGSFKYCKCKSKLLIPTHLIIQLTRAGLVVEEDCQVRLSRTGDFGLNDFVKRVYFKSDSEKLTVDYIDYQSMFKVDEYIRVYADRLAVIRNNKEIKFINNFIYKKFYNSADELIICLLLAKYNIIVTTDVTLGLIDIYNDIDKKAE